MDDIICLKSNCAVWSIVQVIGPCLCKASPSDSLGSVDEELLKELENVPVVLTTQDEMDVRTVVKGLKVSALSSSLPVQHAHHLSTAMCTTEEEIFR